MDMCVHDHLLKHIYNNNKRLLIYVLICGRKKASTALTKRLRTACLHGKKSIDFTVNYLASGCQFFYRYFYGRLPVDHF